MGETPPDHDFLEQTLLQIVKGAYDTRNYLFRTCLIFARFSAG